MAKKRKKTERPEDRPTAKNRPLQIPLSFDEAVERLVNTPRRESESDETKKPGRKK